MFGIDRSYYFLCFIAAFVLFFRLHKNGEPPFAIIGHINPAWGESAWGKLCEAMIFAILGALIGTVLTIPTSPAQAIAAGLGWTGLLSATAPSAGGE
jgi:hypothetical protein